ncbi:UDP-2,4-diacetamido-2,4,6-trideoxy-beta-L-altropyranose hydrolase [Acidobacteria bacterium AH-259-D05]|nr:UDP-2,4-diacetamido-2,4,6-trideoxy-beta-L-altropyranose hydrolase [Acidobacteria bacterium AH-259-D05]
MSRCLTLAAYLKENGHNVVFVCRDLPENLTQLIARRGFKVALLPKPDRTFQSELGGDSYLQWLGVDWRQDAEEMIGLLKRDSESNCVVTDIYGLDHEWEERVREYTSALVVIDDLANRIHNCDGLLDQNYYQDLESRYDRLVPATCSKALGSRFALLHREFHEYRMRSTPSSEDIHRILVYFGAADPTNETLKVIEALSSSDFAIFQIQILVGRHNGKMERLKDLQREHARFAILSPVDNMAELLSGCQLVVGAAGPTTWERCCLGIPSVVVSTADNQRVMAEHAEKDSIFEYLGHAPVSVDDYRKSIKEIVFNLKKRQIFREKGMKLVDGNGTERVYEWLKNVAGWRVNDRVFKTSRTAP